MFPFTPTTIDISAKKSQETSVKEEQEPDC